MLDQTQTQARTAPAEGRQTHPASTKAHDARRRDPRERRDTGADAADASRAAAPETHTARAARADAPQADTPQAAVPGDAQPGEAPVAPTVVATPASAVPTTPATTDATAAPAGDAAGPVPATPAEAAAAQASAAAAIATTPAADTATPAPAADGGQATPAEQPTPGVTPDGAGKPGDHGAQPDHQGRGADAQAPAPTLPPTAAPATAPTPSVAPAEFAPAPAPAQAPAPAAPVPGVTATQAAQAPAPVTTPVPVVAATTAQLTRASLHGTIDKVQDLVRIASTRNGGARATLQLRPVELGLVDVHLRTTRDGLVATISAQDSAGLSALQLAGSELRRSLEDRGVTLARLDLQLAAGQDGRGTGGTGQDRGRKFGGTHGSAGASGLPGDELDGDDDELLVATVTRTPATGRVDIQA